MKDDEIRHTTEIQDLDADDRFRTIVEMAPDGILLTDLDLNVTFASPSAGTVLGGVDASNLLGMNLMGLVHSEDRSKAVENFERAMQGDDTGPAEYRVREGLGNEARICEVHGQLVGDPQAPDEWLFILRDTTEKRRYETKRRQSEELFFKAFQLSPMMMSISTLKDGKYIHLNDAFSQITGYSKEEALGRTSTELGILNPEDRSRMRDMLTSKGRLDSIGLRLRRKDGSPLHVLFFGEVIEVAGKTRLLSVVEDISERRRSQLQKQELEKRLVRAQKLQSVGRLAGGIAHDFNNLLTGILGSVQLAMLELPEDHPAAKHLVSIKQIARRATAVTKQLLTFSREQRLESRVIDLNELIEATQYMISQIIGEDIEMEASLDTDLKFVKGDPTQLDQVLMNLAVNARDAMPDGGKLSIHTRNTELDRRFCRRHPGVQPGRYAMLSVMDDGCGIATKHLDQVFEPFFSTKPQGKGTGMGLAIVHGVVTRHGGLVKVYSREGSGTRFDIFLPSTEAEPEGPTSELPPAEVEGGNETILIVDDDEDVLKVSVRALERLRYHTLGTKDPAKALQLAQDESLPVDLMVTDVIMPKMNGRELANAARKVRPALPVLFASGYTDRLLEQYGIDRHHCEILRKPYAPEELGLAVRKALECSDDS